MKSLNLRLIHTHDVEENWNKTVDFVPKKGEVIVYDVDDNFSYERFKIGDGVTTIQDLPFTIENIISCMLGVQDNVITLDAGRITKYKSEV